MTNSRPGNFRQRHPNSREEVAIARRVEKYNARNRLVGGLWQFFWLILGFIILILILQNALSDRVGLTALPANEQGSDRDASGASTLSELRIMAHSLPRADSDVLTSISAVDQYQVVGNRGDWLKVVLIDGFPAWVSNDDVKRHASGDVEILPSTTFAFSRPDTMNSEVVGALFAGDRVKRIRAKDGWVRVRLPQRSFAWVKQSELSLFTAAL